MASLGVEFDLRQSDKGLVFVSNTKTRRAEILERIETVLQDNMPSKHDTAKLKGCLTFAEGQLFGRASTAFSIRLHKTCFAAFQTVFSSGKPRCVDMRSREIVYLFTDAHYEGRKGGLGGGVLFKECELLNADDREQIITELEALAVLASLRLWKGFFLRKHLRAFVDNEGARGAILRGRSSDWVLNAVAHEAAVLVEASGVLSWYARVPRVTNPADCPSRMLDASWLPANKRALERRLWQLPVLREEGR